MTESDPFELLGVEASFDLDKAGIRRAYRRRAAALHPDATGSDAADEGAAMLNRAVAQLEDPERRATALLTRLGGPAASDDQSLPEGFLLEIMSVRESVEEAIQSGDPERRREWEAWSETRRATHVQSVSRAFAEIGDPPDAGALAAIRRELNAWRYVERLIEQLDPDYDPASADFADDR